MTERIEMSHSEKVEMYRMVEKDRLIDMLIDANSVICAFPLQEIEDTDDGTVDRD